jgi:hypothetical protein
VIAEALDTLWTLGWAFLAWLIVFAAACALTLTAITAAILALGRALKTACVRLRGRHSASGGPEALPEPKTAHAAPQAPPRPTPAWAHTDKEAA